MWQSTCCLLDPHKNLKWRRWRVRSLRKTCRPVLCKSDICHGHQCQPTERFGDPRTNCRLPARVHLNPEQRMASKYLDPYAVAPNPDRHDLSLPTTTRLTLRPAPLRHSMLLPPLILEDRIRWMKFCSSV